MYTQDIVSKGVHNSIQKYVGEGMMIYQSPEQLSGLLELITQYKIDSYLEIGTSGGGTFCYIDAILRYLNPKLKSCTVDVLDKRTKIAKDYMKERENDITFIKESSLTLVLDKKFDLVFIDGNHSHKAISNDYKKWGEDAKIVVFHDVCNSKCKDAVSYWNTIKVGKEAYEFITKGSYASDNYGIGAIITPLAKKSNGVVDIKKATEILPTSVIKETAKPRDIPRDIPTAHTAPLVNRVCCKTCMYFNKTKCVCSYNIILEHRVAEDIACHLFKKLP